MLGRCPRTTWRLALVVAALNSAVTCGCAGRTTPSVPQGKPSIAVKDPATSASPEHVISALEKFLRRDDIDRPMRAQAMFRLATLKDDVGRARADESGALHLEPAIALYAQIIREFPESSLLPSIHYFLAHALVDSQRVDEGQHVFRVLVCQNHFTFTPAADPKAIVTPTRLPQDHDAAFWTAWETRHPLPVDRSPGRALGPLGDEMEFVNPYPPDCRPMTQTTPPGEAPRFLGEAWLRIGDHHFNQLSAFDGPYSLNRAEVAYRQAIRHGAGLIRTLAMYKLAWTYFKQQRYEAAIAQFVELLRHIDAQQSRAEGSGVDIRKEAYTYIAGALIYVDLVGPGPDDPFIPREDVLDTEKNPRIAEQKMHVAIDRVRDPKIIPQNETWTSDVYAALIMEFRQLMQLRNMVETSELFLARWPSDLRAGGIRQTMEQARVQLGSSSLP